MPEAIFFSAGFIARYGTKIYSPAILSEVNYAKQLFISLFFDPDRRDSVGWYLFTGPDSDSGWNAPDGANYLAGHIERNVVWGSLPGFKSPGI